MSAAEASSSGRTRYSRGAHAATAVHALEVAAEEERLDALHGPVVGVEEDQEVSGQNY